MRPAISKSHRLAVRLITAAVGSVVLAAAASSQTPPAGPIESLAAWDKIATVLQHPRCLNCHQTEAPLRGDARRPHVPPVARGVSTMRCKNCHSETANNPNSGVPGAAHWVLAPDTMGWDGLSAGEMCRKIKNPDLNHGRSPQALIEHVETDPLVRWAWNPGKNREPIPVPYREFVELIKVWVAGGAVCPA